MWNAACHVVIEACECASGQRAASVQDRVTGASGGVTRVHVRGVGWCWAGLRLVGGGPQRPRSRTCAQRDESEIGASEREAGERRTLRRVSSEVRRRRESPRRRGGGNVTQRLLTEDNHTSQHRQVARRGTTTAAVHMFSAQSADHLNTTHHSTRTPRMYARSLHSLSSSTAATGRTIASS